MENRKCSGAALRTVRKFRRHMDRQGTENVQARRSGQSENFIDISTDMEQKNSGKGSRFVHKRGEEKLVSFIRGDREGLQ